MEIISHHVCRIPEIQIAISTDQLSNLNKERARNKEKREVLLSAIKRWIYLSWLLQTKEQTAEIKELYQDRWIWSEIDWIKNTLIPTFLFPYNISYIVPDYQLQTGKLIQLNENRPPVDLDFTSEIPPKPIPPLTISENIH